MILTIAQDFSSTVSLDSELTSIPDSKMYLNSGVHPSINVDNLLSYLPNIDFTFLAYNAGTTYNKYTDSRNASDLVVDGGLIYQSLTASNTGNTPSSSPSSWLLTNIESLRIKSFVLMSQDTAIQKINLTRKLVDNQYMYNLVEVTDEPNVQLLPNDYAAWVFEPRGSDYVRFRINEASIQATTDVQQNLYVINQGVLIDTLVLNPNTEGRLVFERLDYEFFGKGKFIFAIDAQNVLTNGSTIDPLKYDGFVVYTAQGIGLTPESADYNISTSNNGLGFNLTAYFDSDTYLTNNLVEFGRYLQAAWELDVLNMFLANSNNRSNRNERSQSIDRPMLIAETKELNAASKLRDFEKEREKAISMLKLTLDRMFKNEDDNEIEIEVSSV